MSICPPFFFFFFFCFFICILQALSKAQISNETSTLQMEASYRLSSTVLKVREAKMSFGLYYAYSLIIYCSLLLQQIFGSSCSTTPTDDRQSPISSSTGFLNALPTSYILYWDQSYLHSLEYSCYCSFMCLETHSILLPWVTKERNICFKSSQAIHTPIVLNYLYSTSASNLTRPLCSSSYLKLWVSISIPPSTSSILWISPSGSVKEVSLRVTASNSCPWLRSVTYFKNALVISRAYLLYISALPIQPFPLYCELPILYPKAISEWLLVGQALLVQLSEQGGKLWGVQGCAQLPLLQGKPLQPQL